MGLLLAQRVLLLPRGRGGAGLSDTARQGQRIALDRTIRGLGLDLGGDLAEQRALFVELASEVPVANDVDAGEDELGGVPVVTVATPGIDAARVVFYIHGGAFVLGSAATSVSLVCELSRRAGARAVSVDYRLAPEHPFPAAPQDVLAAYAALLAGGVQPADVAVVGESAGGGLAAGLLVSLGRAGLPQPACGVVLSPWADLSLSGASVTSKAAVDPFLTADALRRRAADYLGDADPRSAEFSPLFADLSGLPPVLIQAGSHEILLDDAVRLAERAAHDDVPVQLQVWPGVPHVFQAYSAVLDDAVEALDAAAAFILRHRGS